MNRDVLEWVIRRLKAIENDGEHPDEVPEDLRIFIAELEASREQIPA